MTEAKAKTRQTSALLLVDSWETSTAAWKANNDNEWLDEGSGHTTNWPFLEFCGNSLVERAGTQSKSKF